ncbi:hypothetical protein WA171_004485, partial [Blastocystis sp. BT1]
PASTVDYSRYAGYVSSREKIWYEPHESRVSATKYQAQVPEYDEDRAIEYLHCAKEGISGGCINEDVVQMNNRCVFTPESVVTRSEEEIDEYIQYVTTALGGGNRFMANENESEEIAWNLLFQCNGSIERARLYVDSQLGYGCELTMMETERRHTGNGKSSVHYHIDHEEASFELVTKTQKLWSEWKKRVAQIHNDDGSYEEYIQRLEEAQRLISKYGNPSSRIFAKIEEIKNILDVTNNWRATVHDLLYQHKVVSIEKLKALLQEFPENGADCDERQRIMILVESIKQVYRKAIEVSTQQCSQEEKNQLWNEVDRMEVQIEEIKKLRRE